MSNALETTRLGKRYGRAWALQDCTLALPAGRVAALVGPNGAGKTTLLHLAAGLLEPTMGKVQIFGLSPRAEPHEALPRLGIGAQAESSLGWRAGASADAEAGHSTGSPRGQALRRAAGAGGARVGAGEAA